ncbi:hypothetical protein CBL_04166 [Carabus blaptoides fortunei]
MVDYGPERNADSKQTFQRGGGIIGGEYSSRYEEHGMAYVGGCDMRVAKSWGVAIRTDDATVHSRTRRRFDGVVPARKTLPSDAPDHGDNRLRDVPPEAPDRQPTSIPE